MSAADDAAFALAYRMAGEALEAAMRELEFVGPPNPSESPVALVISSRINLGRPKPLLSKRKGSRGRPPTRNQYDRAVEVRRRCFAFLRQRSRASALGKSASLLDRPGVMNVVEGVLSDRSIPPRRRVAEIVRRHAEAGLGPVLDETSVRRALKRTGRI